MCTAYHDVSFLQKAQVRSYWTRGGGRAVVRQRCIHAMDSTDSCRVCPAIDRCDNARIACCSVGCMRRSCAKIVREGDGIFVSIYRSSPKLPCFRMINTPSSHVYNNKSAQCIIQRTSGHNTGAHREYLIQPLIVTTPPHSLSLSTPAVRSSARSEVNTVMQPAAALICWHTSTTRCHSSASPSERVTQARKEWSKR
jgi:hypothetical protein